MYFGYMYQGSINRAFARRRKGHGRGKKEKERQAKR